MNRAIFIPTYRRTEQLVRCLISIILDCQKSEIDDLKIFVSSNDDNEIKKELVLGLKKLYEPIYYEVNETNLGIDLNMKKAFFLNEVDYVLLLGDDDVIAPGFVKRFYEETQDFDISFFVMNQKNIKGERIRDFNNDIVYTDMREAFINLYDKMPYGSLIVRIDNKELFSDADRFIGTYHLYSGVLWDMVKDGGKIKVIAYPEVIVGDCVKSYAEYVDDVYQRAIPKWHELIPSIFKGLII